MSLEAYRSRLRALELAAQKLATSADCSGTSEPELIQIAMHFHPAEGTSTRAKPPPSLSPQPHSP